MQFNRMKRKQPARPIRWLIDQGRIPKGGVLLHHGRGYDFGGSAILEKFGRVAEYDPGIKGIDDEKTMMRQYDTIISIYVLNCLPEGKRGKVISRIAGALKKTGVAYIAARGMEDEKRIYGRPGWTAHQDGVRKGDAFQTCFEVQKFRKMLIGKFPWVKIIKTRPLIAECRQMKLPMPCPRYGFGKRMGKRIYLHKSVAHRFPGIMRLRKKLNGFPWAVARIDESDGSISLIRCDDFDSAAEPTVGDSLLFRDGRWVRHTRQSKDPWIYHHKWLFVEEEYDGFNIFQSRNRSAAWLALDLDKSRIGKKSYWEKKIIPLIHKGHR